MSRRVIAALIVWALLVSPTIAQEGLDTQDLRSRAEAGDKRATRALAEAYYLGRGSVKQDFPEAARWYRRLASQGDARAQTSLGLMYANGLGFEKNLVEARRWWSLAAAQNDAGAQHNLAMLFLAGQGVARDPAQALYWFQRAAERGHVQSQRVLGLMYYDGEGTSRDRLRGLTWLTIAADNGEEGAQQALKTLTKRIDAEQFEQARVLAQKWLQENAATR